MDLLPTEIAPDVGTLDLADVSRGTFSSSICDVRLLQISVITLLKSCPTLAMTSILQVEMMMWRSLLQLSRRKWGDRPRSIDDIMAANSIALVQMATYIVSSCQDSTLH